MWFMSEKWQHKVYIIQNKQFKTNGAKDDNFLSKKEYLRSREDPWVKGK